MAAHIPFVSGELDFRLAAEFYSDARVIRLPLEKAGNLTHRFPKGPKIWIDPEVDGFDRPFSKSNGDWQRHVKQFPGYESIGDAEFQASPDRGLVEEFVASVLDACSKDSPAAITVPQLPIVNDASRNKMNRTLAAAAAKWKAASGYRGRFILPAILTDQRQLNRKKSRDSKRRAILNCYQKSGADGLWSVDSTLSDQMGSETFRNVRFPGLIAFHEELLKELPDRAITIAGPYWGLNLVLWVRGLCHYPAIGVGSGYQYHIAGGKHRAPLPRVAIPSLRRWVRAGGLRDWLPRAMKRIHEEEPAYEEFGQIKSSLATLTTKEASRRQVATFYKEWFDEVEAVPAPGRALALYQMLSSAYVLGKTLPSLPATEKTARRPERVAEYLMLNCL